MKSVREEIVTATAAGEKFFDFSTAKSMFKKFDTGDLLLLAQTKSLCLVALLLSSTLFCLSCAAGMKVPEDTMHQLLLCEH